VGRATRRLNEPVRVESEAGQSVGGVGEDHEQGGEQYAREIESERARRSRAREKAERTDGREHNWMIQFGATGKVLIQDSYILEIQSQSKTKRNKETNGS
jgi:hypothetical protein